MCGPDILSTPRGPGRPGGLQAQKAQSGPAGSKEPTGPARPEIFNKIFNEVSVDFGCHSPQDPARPGPCVFRPGPARRKGSASRPGPLDHFSSPARPSPHNSESEIKHLQHSWCSADPCVRPQRQSETVFCKRRCGHFFLAGGMHPSKASLWRCLQQCTRACTGGGRGRQMQHVKAAVFGVRSKSRSSGSNGMQARALSTFG